MIITLDGPCGSGKSTLAQLISKKLGFFYLNSGYIYRALGYVLGGDADLEAVEECFENIVYNPGQILYKGEDITGKLKTNEVSQKAAVISKNKEIRELIDIYKRGLAQKKGNLIMDGRDGGSVVFPNADYKFYITAPTEVRAKRLVEDYQRRFDKELLYEDAYNNIYSRDESDKTRKYGRLVKPEGCIVIDTSDMDVEETLEKVIGFIN
jgi:cytidylate kinase